MIQATTVSTATGAYTLYLPPDTYNIVVFREGYLPACQEVAAQYYEEYSADYNLTEEAGVITISGVVSGLETGEDSARLSFRQTADCGSGEVTIEVASAVVADEGEYSITLPAGTYDLVASATGETTQVYAGISMDTELDIDFAQ